MIYLTINKYIFPSLFVVVLASSCHEHKIAIDQAENYKVIKCLNDYNAVNHNDTVVVVGKLKEFLPMEIGKGGGTQYFDYEIRLRNRSKVPIRNFVKIDSKYLNKKIKTLGVLECGPISQTDIQNINLKRLQCIITIEELK